MPTRDALARYASESQAHLRDLERLVRIPSISAAGFPAAAVRQSADAVAALLQSRGLENVQILELDGAHPYVYGDWLHAGDKPTVLLYAHHDVQPPGREEVWETPPFEPTLRDGRLYARGAADDKAGIIAHTATLDAWLGRGAALPVNVKLIIEGEEEIGSIHLEEFLRVFSEKLSADVMVLTDAANWDTGVPALTTLLRGLVMLDVEVCALERPLHSGMWGGPIPDPVMGLARMLATLVDAEGRIAVPGVYDRVRPLSQKDKTELERLPTSVEEFCQQASLRPGVQLLGDWVTPWQAVWRQPSLVVNAIQASSRALASNIICDSAWARVGLRIVPDQKPDEIQRLVIEHLSKQVPWGLEVSFESPTGAPWWITQPEGKAFDRARQALELGYGKPPLLIGCGGTIPFAAPFSRALGDVPALLVGIEDPYTNAHAENESLHLGDFHKAVASQIHLLDLLSRD